MSDAQAASDSVQPEAQPEEPVLLPSFEFPEGEAAAIEPVTDEVADETKADEAEDAQDDETARERDENGRFRKIKPAQPRFDELTRKVGEAQREAEFWKARANAREQSEQAQADAEPQESDFPDDYAGYLRAITRHDARQIARETVQESRAQAEAQSRAEAEAGAWEKGVTAAKAKHADYAEVMASADSVQLATHLKDLLLSSDSGPMLAYEIATDPAIAERLNRLPPMLAAKEFARLEDRITKPIDVTPAPNQAARKTAAPRPATPIPAQRITTPDLDSMSVEEMAGWMKDKKPQWKWR